MVIKFLDRNLQVSSSSFCYTQSILFSSVHYKHHFSDVHTVLHFQAVKLVVHVQALKISVAKYNSNGESKSNQKTEGKMDFLRQAHSRLEVLLSEGSYITPSDMFMVSYKVYRLYHRMQS